MQNRAEIDGRDVLERYSALMAAYKDDGRGVIRHISELPYPKSVIKTVLQHALKITDDRSTREVLKAAYLTLADFQELTDAEVTAVRKWNQMLRSSVDAKPTEQQVAEADNYLRLLNRTKEEMDQLNADLKLLDQEQ